MKIEFIPKFVALLAGAIVSVITIVKDMDATHSMGWLLGSILVFYIVGIIAQKIIYKVVSGNRYIRVDDGDENMQPLKSTESEDEVSLEEESVSE